MPLGGYRSAGRTGKAFSNVGILY